MNDPNNHDWVNIVFNLSAGMLPEELNPSEVKKLKEHYGENWFEKLGYTYKNSPPEGN